jgi:ribosomal protein S18 acetylase RimI-like enzyme
MWKVAAQKAASLIIRDYWNGWMYSFEPCTGSPDEITADNMRCDIIEDAGLITSSPYPEIRQQGLTRVPDSWPFGVWVGDELAGVCWFQARDTHRMRGGIFNLADDEAELGQLTIAAAFRGRGLASILMKQSCREMSRRGFRKIYGKIWRDNTASMHATERAGWRRDQRFFSFRLRGWSKRFTLKLPS